MKLKIDQTMWQFSAAIFSSVSRMFSIIFSLFVQSCKWEIIWLERWLILPRSLLSPAEGEIPRSTSGVLEGERVAVWPDLPYLGTDKSGKSTELSLSVDVGLGMPAFFGGFAKIFSWKTIRRQKSKSESTWQWDVFCLRLSPLNSLGVLWVATSLLFPNPTNQVWDVVENKGAAKQKNALPCPGEDSWH